MVRIKIRNFDPKSTNSSTAPFIKMSGLGYQNIFSAIISAIFCFGTFFLRLNFFKYFLTLNLFQTFFRTQINKYKWKLFDQISVAFAYLCVSAVYGYAYGYADYFIYTVFFETLVHPHDIKKISKKKSWI